MYKLEVCYGDVDEPEMVTAEIPDTTYESFDEACEAASSKFYATMERLLDDPELRFVGPEACLDEYYVVYGYPDPELGYMANRHYCHVSVIER